MLIHIIKILMIYFVFKHIFPIFVLRYILNLRQ